ncbi:MAG: hypothetical protein HOQ05_13740 [Corynebacteriales bacterium]|nr:hypothetical protein [Mycobacteriales bacterium]
MATRKLRKKRKRQLPLLAAAAVATVSSIAALATTLGGASTDQAPRGNQTLASTASGATTHAESPAPSTQKSAPPKGELLIKVAANQLAQKVRTYVGDKNSVDLASLMTQSALNYMGTNTQQQNDWMFENLWYGFTQADAEALSTSKSQIELDPKATDGIRTGTIQLYTEQGLATAKLAIEIRQLDSTKPTWYASLNTAPETQDMRLIPGRFSTTQTSAKADIAPQLGTNRIANTNPVTPGPTQTRGLRH